MRPIQMIDHDGDESHPPHQPAGTPFMSIFPKDPPNPWITQSSEILFDNPWSRLDAHAVTGPDGKDSTYYVTHFHNRACGVVPYEVRGGVPGVWLVGQTRFTLGRYSWELPEGGVPEGEDIAIAARRELKEEAGIEAGTLTWLFDVHTSNSLTDEQGQVFLATDLTHGASDPEGTEDITALFVPMTDALEAIDDGRITDAITVAGLYRTELMRLSGALD
jgi:8-oxo-dGTP pyrophosphatase MutT (NUDIX family)